ncbi:MAG: penicillin acylase family protein, partial [Chitinophagaceae bacterium]|nr:penicillin acylase family protein [Chitinophagaceae bacterium]
YQYDGEWKPAMQKIISIKVKTANGYDTKTFRALFTHHGPVMAKRNGHYITVRHDNRDMNGLIQSWLRTKAGSFADFKKTMDIGANPSNNTVYADAEGNIAYWHGNFMPRRDTNYDWSQPVDGTTSATEWKGFHPVNETVHLYNPPNGWLQNCNSTPFTVAGNNSPKRKDYPAYMAPDGENYRGLNAVRILSKAPKDFT